MALIYKEAERANGSFGKREDSIFDSASTLKDNAFLCVLTEHDLLQVLLIDRSLYSISLQAHRLHRSAILAIFWFGSGAAKLSDFDIHKF